MQNEDLGENQNIKSPRLKKKKYKADSRTNTRQNEAACKVSRAKCGFVLVFFLNT